MAKQLVNRKTYKDIKKFDHKTMEKFFNDVYEEGKAAGKKACNSNISLEKIKAEIINIKGIGEKKTTEIMQIISKVLEVKDDGQC